MRLSSKAGRPFNVGELWPRQNARFRVLSPAHAQAMVHMLPTLRLGMSCASMAPQDPADAAEVGAATAALYEHITDIKVQRGNAHGTHGVSAYMRIRQLS